MRYCIGCLQEECACAEEAFVEATERLTEGIETSILVHSVGGMELEA